MTSMKHDLLTPEERATMDGGEQDKEWSRRWWAMSEEDRTACMGAMIADSCDELRRELPHPEVMDKQTVQGWLARHLAIVTICDVPVPVSYMDKTIEHAMPTMVELFGIKPYKMLIHRARRLAGIESYRDPETGETMWVRRDYSSTEA